MAYSCPGTSALTEMGRAVAAVGCSVGPICTGRTRLTEDWQESGSIRGGRLGKGGVANHRECAQTYSP